MSIFSFFTRTRSAPIARDRLQILLAHERRAAGRSDLVAILREEILAVIAKHMSIDQDKVSVKLDCGDNVSTLEVNVELQDITKAAAS